jgi:hypothetical protein
MKIFSAIALSIFLIFVLDISAQPKIEIENGTKMDWGKVSPKENP